MYPQPMTDDAESLKRLADRVEQRIAELALEYAEVARLAGFSIEALRKIRNGLGARPNTYRKLERGLSWQQGSVAAILAGSEPIPLEAPADEEAPADPASVNPSLEQELELAVRLMAAQVRELGLTPEEAEEAWRRARLRIEQSREPATPPESHPDSPRRHRAG